MTSGINEAKYYVAKYDRKFIRREVLRRETSDGKMSEVESNFWKEWDKYLMFGLEMELMKWRFHIWLNYKVIL